MDSIKTGMFIAECRKQNGLTQKELAQMLNISNRTVSKWENGDGYPDVTIMPQLSQILGVSVDELLAGERAESEQEQILFEAVVPQNSKNYNKLFRLAQNIKIPMWCRIAYLFCAAVSAMTIYCSETTSDYIKIKVTTGLVIGIVLMLLALFTPIFDTLVHMSRQKAIDGKNADTETVIVTGEKIIFKTNMRSNAFVLSDITGFYDKGSMYIIRINKRAFAYITKDSFTVGDSEGFASFIRGKMTVVKERKALKTSISVLTIILIALTSTLFCTVAIMNANHYTYGECIKMEAQELLKLNDEELINAVSCKVSEKLSGEGQLLNECERVFSYIDDFYYSYEEYGFCEYLYYYNDNDDLECLYGAFDSIGMNEISVHIKDFVEKNNINPTDFNSKSDYDEMNVRYPFEQLDKKILPQCDLIERKLAEYVRNNIEAFE